MKLLVNQNGIGRLQNFSSFLAMQDNTRSDSTSLETYFVCFFCLSCRYQQYSSPSPLDDCGGMHAGMQQQRQQANFGLWD